MENHHFPMENHHFPMVFLWLSVWIQGERVPHEHPVVVIGAGHIGLRQAGLMMVSRDLHGIFTGFAWDLHGICMEFSWDLMGAHGV